MTVDNVTQILNKIPGHKWENVMSGLVTWPLLEEIHKRYSTNTEKNHTCADYYVNCHPEAGWKDLAAKLYVGEEFSLARVSKSFMSTGKLLQLHVHCIATDVIHVLLTCLYDKGTDITSLLISTVQSPYVYILLA